MERIVRGNVLCQRPQQSAFVGNVGGKEVFVLLPPEEEFIVKRGVVLK